MYGQNPVRDQTNDPDLLQVHEIFHTIQGEGPYSGERAVFIRLSGCNLRCWWCDTQWDDDKDPYIRTDLIVEHVWDKILYRNPLVVITGGEPCRQDLSNLVTSLTSSGARVQIETAGTLWQSCLRKTTIVVSPKTPLVNPEIRMYANHWKYPLMVGHVSPRDGLPVTNTQIKGGEKREVARPSSYAKVYVTPVDEEDEAANTKNLEVVAWSATTFGYIAQVQLHKYLEVP